MNNYIGIIRQNIKGETIINNDLIPGSSSINIGGAPGNVQRAFNKVYVSSQGIDIDGLSISKINEGDDLLQLPNNLKIGTSYLTDSNGTILINSSNPLTSGGGNSSGETGNQGLKGEKGEQGLKGETGEQGLKGETGEQGLKGETGDKGEISFLDLVDTTDLNLSDNIGKFLAVNAEGTKIDFVDVPSGSSVDTIFKYGGINSNTTFVPTSPNIIENASTTSLNKVTVHSAWMGGGYISDPKEATITEYEGVDNSYIISIIEGTNIKMVQVTLSIVNSTVAIVANEGRYLSDSNPDNLPSPLDSWNNTTNPPELVATSFTSAGYGVYDLQIKISGQSSVGVSSRTSNQLIESFQSKANGESFTMTNTNNIITDNVTIAQILSTSDTQITGSYITYTPNSNTKNTEYSLYFVASYPSGASLFLTLQVGTSTDGGNTVTYTDILKHVQTSETITLKNVFTIKGEDLAPTLSNSELQEGTLYHIRLLGRCVGVSGIKLHSINATSSAIQDVIDKVDLYYVAGDTTTRETNGVPVSLVEDTSQNSNGFTNGFMQGITDGKPYIRGIGNVYINIPKAPLTNPYHWTIAIVVRKASEIGTGMTNGEYMLSYQGTSTSSTNADFQIIYKSTDSFRFDHSSTNSASRFAGYNPSNLSIHDSDIELYVFRFSTINNVGTFLTIYRNGTEIAEKTGWNEPIKTTSSTILLNKLYSGATDSYAPDFLELYAYAAWNETLSETEVQDITIDGLLAIDNNFVKPELSLRLFGEHTAAAIVGQNTSTTEGGAKGETGDQGVKGEKGEQGLKGETGDQGVKGEKGEQGLKGETGDQGIKGETGDQGVTSFLDLFDTPTEFSGFENKILSVNSDGTGIIFTDAPATSGSTSTGVNSEAASGGQGQILEYFELPSDGVSTRTVKSGTYTATTTPSGETTLNNIGSWADIPGTSLEGYTPPQGTKIVYYKCKFLKRKSGEVRAGFTIKLKDDNSGLTEIIAPLSGGSTLYGTSTRPAVEMNWDSSFEMVEVYGSIKIGGDFNTPGTPDLKYGELDSWTSPKTISTVFCTYHSAYTGLRVHYHNIQPLITLIAVGVNEGGSGSGSPVGTNFLELQDTPSSFESNKYLTVNETGTGIIFADTPTNGGATNFLELEDTPNSFVANKYLAINAAGTGITFADAQVATGGEESQGYSTTSLATNRVIEEITTECNGVNIISQQNDTIVVPNITLPQTFSDSFVDVTGSIITYTPPIGSNTFEYSFTTSIDSLDTNNSDKDTIALFEVYVNDTVVDNQSVLIEKTGYILKYEIKTIFTLSDNDDLINKVLKIGETKTIKIMGKSFSSRNISIHKNSYNTSSDGLEAYPTLPNQTTKTYDWQPLRHGWVKVMHMPVSNEVATKFNRGDDLGYLESASPQNDEGSESDLTQVYQRGGSWSSIVNSYDEILLTTINVGFGGEDGNGGIGTDWWLKLDRAEYHNWYALNMTTSGRLENDIFPTTQHLKGGRLWDGNGEFVLARYSERRSGRNWTGLQLKQQKLTKPSDSQYSNQSTNFLYQENNASSSNTMRHPSGLAVYIRNSSNSPAALEGFFSRPIISLRCIGDSTTTVNSSNFTAGHISQNLNILNETLETEWKQGMIVISNGQILNPKETDVNNAWPVVELSRQRQDKRAIGVFTKTTGNAHLQGLSTSGLIINYNSIGEGRILVTDTNGDIENGDYICSSYRAGYGEKQNDDLFHNYTVAKATESCNWSLNGQTTPGVSFKSYLLACTYHSG